MTRADSSFYVVRERQRLDKFLAETLELSRREVQLLLGAEVVWVNRQRVSEKAKGRILEPGLSIEIESLEPLSTQILTNTSKTLTVLYEDSEYLIVDKPAPMPVMPLRTSETETVLNFLIPHYPELQGVGDGGLKSALVHRLDNETSGCLMLARNQVAWERAREAIQAKESYKTYRAIVAGQLDGQGQERVLLEISSHRPAKVRLASQESKASRLCYLSWRVLQTFNSASLVEVDLGTGFLHQIRVIFAHMGYPLLGDTLYGQAQEKQRINRHMLHASRLKVLEREAYSPDPADFQSLLEQLSREK
ncbi:MAG: RluA family pseudouridine synthase [Trueperaceae bacterium]|nr:RluA family pseudouridine synthase [Trueperaceae bacterium]